MIIGAVALTKRRQSQVKKAYINAKWYTKRFIYDNVRIMDSNIKPQIEQLTLNEVWAAGFLSGTGSLHLAEGRPTLTIKSTTCTSSVVRLANIIGATPRNIVNGGKPGVKVVVSGGPLHRVMRALWAQLPAKRKREYQVLIQAARDYVAAK